MRQTSDFGDSKRSRKLVEGVVTIKNGSEIGTFYIRIMFFLHLHNIAGDLFI